MGYVVLSLNVREQVNVKRKLVYSDVGVFVGVEPSGIVGE